MSKQNQLVASDKTPAIAQRELTSPRGAVLAGSAIIVLVFGVFGVWAAVAPLNGAIIGEGTVVVEGNRLSVDHLEGGVVSSIRVREGDTVSAGQVLITLDDTRLRAQNEIYSQQLAVARATEARLLAERTDAIEVLFPRELTSNTEPYAVEAMASQREEFAARHTALEGEREVLRYQIEDLNKQIEGKELRIASVELQIASVVSERETLDSLFAQGLSTRERILALERNETSLRAEKAEYEANIASFKVNIVQYQQRIQQVSLDRKSEIARELVTIQQRILDVAPSLDVARQGLARSQVMAPQPGRVVGLKVFSVGEVITPGETVLEIVPEQTPLVISSRFRLEDIAELEVGSIAEIHFTSFTELYVPVVQGEVTVVSADRIVDERSGVSYYLAQISVDPAEVERTGKIELHPGMPATVMVTTRPRTALQYLVGPLLATFDGSFRQY